jgi:hypothetical protein
LLYAILLPVILHICVSGIQYFSPMEIAIHEVNHIKIAEVISNGMVITGIEEGTDLLGNLFYQGIDRAIIHSANITPAFFDLKTGIAGEILQKFTNYRVRLAIVGNFKSYTSKSLHDFIYESNKSKQVNFVASTQEALERLST